MTAKQFIKNFKNGDKIHLFGKWMPFQFVIIKLINDDYFVDTLGYRWALTGKWKKVKRVPAYDNGFLFSPVVLENK